MIWMELLAIFLVAIGGMIWYGSRQPGPNDGVDLTSFLLTMNEAFTDLNEAFIQTARVFDETSEAILELKGYWDE